MKSLEYTEHSISVKLFLLLFLLSIFRERVSVGLFKVVWRCMVTEEDVRCLERAKALG